MNIHSSIDSMIGGTPLLDISRFAKAHGLDCRLLAKLEYMNPAGSAKDRVAREIIDAAERRGEVVPGSVIIEPTSGNTGIGLAAIAASRGYRAILVMPDTMSVERQNILKALGAEVVLTPGAEGMSGSIKKAEELAKELPHSFIAGQFDNPDNPMAHYRTTGPEIWSDTDGRIDAYIATVGTGGTLSGTGRYLREQKPDIRIIAVEPAGSPLLSGGAAGAHKIQGIGANFIPATLDRSIYDEVMTVEDDACFVMAKSLAHTEGILVGISSGAALDAAVRYGSRPECKGQTVVVLLPDGGDRYYSSPLFVQ